VSNVLFVCIQNAGRSQIAQALFDRAAGGRHHARSAGSRPAERVHPEVVAVLAELGIDVAGNIPHRLDADDMAWADVVVTMGCGDECPFVPVSRSTACARCVTRSPAASTSWSPSFASATRGARRR
jgi:arsenate reductase (thioredoxin)